MCESNYIEPYVHKEFVRGGFWNALFHLDFSKKDVTYYYDKFSKKAHSFRCGMNC